MNHVLRRLSPISALKMAPTFIPSHSLQLRKSRAPSTSSFTRQVFHRAPTRRAHLHPVRIPILAVQEAEWSAVKIVENDPICEGHRHIVVSVGADEHGLADGYRVPGQYVQIRPDESAKPGFFAISSPPSVRGSFEFLIKETPNVSWFTSSNPGDVVEMSPVQGKGFPVAKLDPSSYPEEDSPMDVLLFATGSGIAPIRAVIESDDLRIKDRRCVKLFYGARYPGRMAFMDRFKEWEKDGVEVIPVMSQPDKGKLAWDGETGYVQDVLKDVGVESPRQTAAVLCGVKGMTVDVSDVLVGAGVPKDRILFNF